MPKNTTSLLGLLLLAVGCSSIPKGSSILYDAPLDTDRLENVSDKFQGRYLRVTNRLTESFTLGGSKEHKHAITHVHDSVFSLTLPYKPLGADATASAVNHEHAFQSITQSNEDTSPASNEFDRIEMGLARSGKPRIKRVPVGTIIGFIGPSIPLHWQSVATEDAFISISKKPASPVQKLLASPHVHKTDHTHNWTMQPSSRMIQTFQNATAGDTIATIDHRHKSIEGTPWVGATDTLKTGLPSLGMKFIRSTHQVKRLPPGSVLVYQGKRTPRFLGIFPTKWRSLGTVTDRPTDGHFWNVNETVSRFSITSASTTHRHVWDHRHTVSSGPSIEVGALARSGANQPISLRKHTHTTTVVKHATTGESEHIPLFLNVFLIVKK